MDTILTLKKEIRDAADVVAAAFFQKLSPKLNNLSKAEAYEMAGRRWIDDQIKRGNIKGYRIGNGGKNSKIYFSRLEIAALMLAESTYEAELKE